MRVHPVIASKKLVRPFTTVCDLVAFADFMRQNMESQAAKDIEDSIGNK